MEVHKKTKIFRGWWVVCGCFFIMMMPFAVVFLAHSIFLPPVTTALGFSATQFSIVFTIVAIATALSSPFVGKLIIKYDIRYVMALSGGVVSVAFGLLGVARLLWHFYLLAAVLGVFATGITQVPVANIVTNWFPTQKRGVATGIAFAGGNVGSFLTIQIITNLLPKIGYANCYFLFGSLMFVITIAISLLVIRGNPEDVGEMPYGICEIDTANSQVQNSFSNGITFSQAKRTGVFWMFIIAIILLGMVFAGIQTHIPSYMIRIGHTMHFAAMVTSVAAITGIISNVLIGTLLEKAGIKIGLSIIGIFMVIAVVFLLISSYAPFAFVFAVLFGMFAAIAGMGPSYITSEMFGQKEYGVIFGFVMMFFQLGGAIGPTLSGLIYDLTGEYRITWLIYIVLLVITFGTFLGSIYLSHKQDNIDVAN